MDIFRMSKMNIVVDRVVAVSEVFSESEPGIMGEKFYFNVYVVGREEPFKLSGVVPEEETSAQDAQQDLLARIRGVENA